MFKETDESPTSMSDIICRDGFVQITQILTHCVAITCKSNLSYIKGMKIVVVYT